MKNLLPLLIVLVSFVFTSCNKEDDPTPVSVSESALIGEWDLIELKVENGTRKTEAFGQVIEATFTTIGKNFNASVTFSENPNEIESQGSYDADISTTIAGQTISQEVTVPEFGLSGTWEVNGDKLIITNSSQELAESVATITELTDENLTMKIDLNETTSQNGATVTQTGLVTYRMKKK